MNQRVNCFWRWLGQVRARWWRRWRCYDWVLSGLRGFGCDAALSMRRGQRVSEGHGARIGGPAQATRGKCPFAGGWGVVAINQMLQAQKPCRRLGSESQFRLQVTYCL